VSESQVPLSLPVHWHKLSDSRATGTSDSAVRSWGHDMAAVEVSISAYGVRPPPLKATHRSPVLLGPTQSSQLWIYRTRLRLIEIRSIKFRLDTKNAASKNAASKRPHPPACLFLGSSATRQLGCHQSVVVSSTHTLVSKP
jgi:hypothetical protein